MAKKENVDFNVMEAISVLADNLKGSKLKIRRTQKFLKAEEQLNSYFAITSRGTWMLCGIIAYYFDHRGQNYSFNSLAHFFNVSVMTVAAYTDGVRELLKKRYIQNIESFDESEIGLSNEFKLSKELVSCILHNKKIYISQKNTKTDLFEKIKKMGEVIDGNDDCFEKEFKIEEAEKKFADEVFIKDVMQLVPNLSDRMFFYSCCNDLLESNETNLNCTISNIYPDRERLDTAESFMNEKHILIKKDLVEFTTKGTLTEATLDLTVKAKEMLLGEKAKLFIKKADGIDIVEAENIKAKELFYSEANDAEISRLKSSLYEENLQLVQERLSQKNLPKGIAVLLYGAPGTGKTESVYQIARETGRAIFHVDISSAKSCWFGESEKIIKRIFTDYKQMRKAAKSSTNGKMPILLFNEADGIFSKRKDTAAGNTSQTENAMQNIILEEMENLEGIMICTTNLADNLDVALERRFLFKIKFENPTVEAKQKIWKSKLGWLSDDVISNVAENYDLSGGQIDNIVRKITMDEVLTGKLPDTNELRNLCK